jgi:hypothetical protein
MKMETFKKSSVATAKKSFCNIQKSSVATSKKTLLQHGVSARMYKQQEDGFEVQTAPALAHHI